MALPLLTRRRVPLAGPNAMIAAATIGAAQVSLAKNNNPWAEQAWDYYDAIGELRYASNWLGNALSRATLYIARTPEQGGQPERVEDSEAQETLYALAGGLAGQSEMLKAFGVHLTIAGDCYLVGFNDPKTKVQRWVVRSPEEVNAYTGTVVLKIDGSVLTLPEADVALVRIWRPHPRRSWEADSPTRGVLPVLYELERLTQMVAAQANSRLAGAGLLIIPAEFDFPTPPGYPGDGESNPQVSKLQSFVNRLGHAMITPVSDRSDPNSVVPVIVTAPGDQIGNVKLIQFWTPLDGQAIELRKEAIRRFALGMDMPPEILLGMGGTNHWSGWQIDEAAIKLHIEPLLSLVCDALTVGFLHPLLGEDTDLMIWFDTTELVQRPNRAPDAFQLHDRLLLSDEDLVKETGFTQEQMPDDEEKNTRQLRKMVDAGGAGMAEQAAISLGIFDAAPEEPALAEEPPAPEQAASEEPAPAEAPPAEGTAENPGPPAGGPEQASTIASAAPVTNLAFLAPVLVAHALDYLGKRWLKGQPRGMYPRGLEARRIHEVIPVPEDRIDTLLAGAFDALRGSAPEHVLDAVTSYVREIAIAGRAYDPQKLVAGLTAAAAPSRNGHGRL